MRDENVSIDVRVEVAMNTKTIDGSAGVSSFISDTKIPQEIRMIFVRGFVRWGSAITLAEIAPILKEPGIRETVVSFLVHEAHSNPWFILGETMPIFRDPSISISTKECIMGLVHIGSASTDIGKFMRDEEIPGSMKRRLIERLS